MALFFHLPQVLASVREQPHLPHNQGKLNQPSFLFLPTKKKKI